MLNTRICRVCKREQLATLEFFFQDYSMDCTQDNPYGVGSYCKACSKRASRERRFEMLHSPQQMERRRRSKIEYRTKQREVTNDEYVTEAVQ